MTEELARAIHLISPHCNFRPKESNRAIWEADQNGACWAEYEVLHTTLSQLPKPMRILEIGPGMGRSLVFFSKKFGWGNCDIHAFEGNGTTTKYTMNGPRFEDSFCGTISELRRVLEFNNVRNVTIHDTQSESMRDLPGPFDLVYGFYTIGFHWSLEHFLDDVLRLIGDKGLAVFTVTSDFQPFEALNALQYKVLDQENSLLIDAPKLLVLSRRPLAAFNA